MIFDNVSRTVTGRGASGSLPDEVVYVPFVLDSGTTTNAVLSVGITGQDSVYRLLYARHYREAGYDTAGTGWNASDLFHFFAAFDYTLFGHTQFLILDSLLCRPATDSGRIVATLVEHNGQPVSGRAAEWITCTTWSFCRVSGGNEQNSTRTASHAGPCEFSTWCYITGGGGGVGSGGGNGPSDGGGGGGNSWWIGDPCPTEAVSQRGSTTNTPNCGPGWTPVVPGQFFDPYAADAVEIDTSITNNFPCVKRSLIH